MHIRSVEYRTFNYRFAEQIFESQQFQQIKWEIIDIVQRVPVIKLSKPKHRKRGKLEKTFTTDQTAINKWLDSEFRKREWAVNPDITGNGKTKLQADFKKGRVQVEAQFGNMARWYTDVFKLQVSYSLGLIDVGVLIVPTQHFANTIDENIVYFERIERELPYAIMSISLPIQVIGIEPKRKRLI